MPVPVTISVNGGMDWATTYASYAYVPALSGMLIPDFGPQEGGTEIQVHLPRRFHESEEDLELNQVTACCFGDPPTALAPATRIEDSVYSCIVPPWPRAPATVSVGIMQADGRCQLEPRMSYSFVEDWRVMRVYPETIGEAELGATDILIVGQNFRSYHGALCRFGDGSITEARVLQSNQSLTCRAPGDASSLRSNPAGPEILEVQVALNGVDFRGGIQPIMIRFVPGPSITKLSPSHVYATGQAPITLYGSQFRPDLRWCIFGEGNDHLQVPIASMSSEREVVCEAPSWMIKPVGESMQKVLVRLSVDGIADALFSQAYVTFVAPPEVEQLTPNEGPVEGGTQLRIYGKYFQPTPPEGVDPLPVEVPLRCIFGTRESHALVLSDTELVCTAPATEAVYFETGYLAPFLIQTVPSYPEPVHNPPMASPGPLLQLTYYYRRFIASFSYIAPRSGPEFGMTLVTLRSDYPLLNSRLIKCVFEEIPVEMHRVSAYEATCLSPPYSNNTVVPLRLTTDGQNRVEIGPGGTPIFFEYYMTPTVVSATPPYGTRAGGTVVQIQGSHFKDSGLLACKFGDMEVKAMRFISPELILCVTPKHMPAIVSVTVSNNGQNFTAASDTQYEFLNYLFFNLNPYLGPVSGNTTVSIEVERIPEVAKDWIRCSFGGLVVRGTRVNMTHLTCVSPPVVTAGEVPLYVTLNLQDRTEASQKYLYYDSPFVSVVDPPLGPVNQALSIRLYGGNFLPTHHLRVRFGGVSVENPGLHMTRPALCVSSTELIVELPTITPEAAYNHRMPLYISNNDQNYAPEGVQSWDPDDDSHDGPKSMRYFFFYDHPTIEQVDPEYGMLYGGGFVNVYGHNFYNTSTMACSFEFINSPTAIFISSTHIMCEVPNMLEMHSAKTVGIAQVRITVNGQDWSRTSVNFRFIGVCPLGHYCRHFGVREYTFRIIPCDTGHMCEVPGLAVPTPCSPGSFQAYRRQAQCQMCPTGFYCPHDRMQQPKPCPRGWTCDELGLIVPGKRCPRGHYCGPGVATSLPRLTMQLEGAKPKPCPPGMHCYEGAVAPASKPHNYSTAQPCFQGYFCPPGSATAYGVGACPLGRYCPTPRHTGILCPERYMCGPRPAQIEPTACPEGTFNPWPGQANCTLCLQGYVCPRNRLRLPVPCPCGYECSDRALTRAYKLCPAGLMCDEGVATTLEPILCEPKYFDPFTDVNSQTAREKICDYVVGQHFVTFLQVVTVPKVADRFGWSREQGNVTGRGACCWDANKVNGWLADEAFKYRKRGFYLLERSYKRLVALSADYTKEEQELHSSNIGFDGLVLLNQTDDDFRIRWGMLYPKARSELWHLLETAWEWTRPIPCPSGSFCEAGTCPRYAQTGKVDIDFFAESGADDDARRLTAKYVGALQNQAKALASVEASHVDDGSTDFLWRRLSTAWSSPEWADDDAEDRDDDRKPVIADVKVMRICNSTLGNCTEVPVHTSTGSSTDYNDDEEKEGYSRDRKPQIFDFEPCVVNGSWGNCSEASKTMHLFASPAADVTKRKRLLDLYAVSDYEALKRSVTLGSRQWVQSMGKWHLAPNDTNGSRAHCYRKNGLIDWHCDEEKEKEKFARRLQSGVEPVPLFNPLAAKSPRQCSSGTFCNPRADSSAGTAICPLGMFCNPGVGEPEPAPEGVFVTEPGRVRGMQCFPGQYAPFKSTPVCLPCPAGNSCPTFGTTIPYICAPGSFRQPSLPNYSSSISCEPCGAGTWSPWRGTPDFSACEPCPAGRVCPAGTGNVSMGMACPEGYICGEGTTHHEKATPCLDGFYCGPSTKPADVYNNLCPAGFYCARLTTLANRYKYRCPQGFYCPQGTGKKKDLDRSLFHGVAYVDTAPFYKIQKISLFCVRQRMRTLQRYIESERRNLLALGLPDMHSKERRRIMEGWTDEFNEKMTCQKAAVKLIMSSQELLGLSPMEPKDDKAEDAAVDFIARKVLKLVSHKHAADYSNKCSRYDPELDGQAWPTVVCPPEMPADLCPRNSQLECFCTAPNLTAMESCFDDAVTNKMYSLDCLKESKFGACIDASLDPMQNIQTDDFDLMARHHLAYTYDSLVNELEVQLSIGENSRTRCPMGTLTLTDGQSELSACKKRLEIPYIYDTIDMITARLNPVDLGGSAVRWANHSTGSLEDEENFRPIFQAPAGTIYLITFDLRHIPAVIQPGTDWRVKFFVNDTLDPNHNDPVECGDLLSRFQNNGDYRTELRDEIVFAARQMGCTEIILPWAYDQHNKARTETVEGQATVTAKTGNDGTYTFVLHAVVDCEWRVEVQIINGLYLQDRFMFVRSALVEYAEPSRAITGTRRFFAIEMREGRIDGGDATCTSLRIRSN
eukprot:TRINITY_DN34467_c0_g1_i2.p1 TRINITY_DN34467_c0_g1~~TRINITY_DN34467_c0_g1_i2.p1  ORF type:complete len:2673 (-),score=484.12 TRINITY_DN34467_c0_g1_i2:4120-11166(-)